MSLALTVRAMVIAGCTAEQIAAVVAAHEGETEKKRAAKRAKNAARMREARAQSNAHNGAQGARAQSAAHTPQDKKEKSPRTPLKEKNPTPLLPLSSADADDPPTTSESQTELVDWFEGQWNTLARTIGLVSIRAMTDRRARAIRCRADDLVGALGFHDPRSGFVETFNRIRGSPFLRGASNGGRAWKCDVDWLLTESNFLKVHEGKYAQEQGSFNRR